MFRPAGCAWAFLLIAGIAIACFLLWRPTSPVAPVMPTIPAIPSIPGLSSLPDAKAPSSHAQPAENPNPPAATLQSQLKTLEATLMGDRSKLAAAKESCMRRLGANPDYVRVKKTADEAETRVKALREKNTDQNALVAASQDWIGKKSALARMETAAMEQDQAVVAATKELTQHSTQAAAIRKQIENAIKAGKSAIAPLKK